MAHVTMIHGIGQKPEEAALLAVWRRALAGGPQETRIDLGAKGVSSSMVYWADVLYPAPDPNVAAHESTDELETLKSDVGHIGHAITVNGAADPEWLARLAGRLLLEDPALDEPEYSVGSASRVEERFPLPWALKQRFLAAFLRDVHHYLFNVSWTPRAGETYQVQHEIRRRFVEKIAAGAERGRPHVVVSHSMGTVIAYDCLMRVPACPTIDALVTLGSPLGIDEVQDKLTPEWTRSDGFPAQKIEGDWVNIFDRLDVVAALDPELANDFRRGGLDVIRDIHEPNNGLWRHNLRKYFEGQLFRTELRRLLKL
ncbi:hypothetical protein GGE07_001413 [Sinorhizobium terangae]|uniref:Alpha/beta hydrolase n=1 Tax=Sinorhizobium terangae TaxID=110322 RepID=A0A6N7LI72_SINTE|nr:hypothetical protein [Sinorhizobium terangae]MBB4184787.1 hypothetical protein [Sinorhizobium terangae]MQX17467.1 hypothetical protein [Sinorhizobium terangae]